MRSEIWPGSTSDGPFSVPTGSISIIFGVLESWKFVLFDFLILRRSTWILRQPDRIQAVIFKSTVLHNHVTDFKNFRCFRKLKVRTLCWLCFWRDPRGFWDPTWWKRPDAQIWSRISLLYHDLSLRNDLNIHVDVRKMKSTNFHGPTTRNAAENYLRKRISIIPFWILYSV